MINYQTRYRPVTVNEWRERFNPFSGKLSTFTNFSASCRLFQNDVMVQAIGYFANSHDRRCFIPYGLEISIAGVGATEYFIAEDLENITTNAKLMTMKGSPLSLSSCVEYNSDSVFANVIEEELKDKLDTWARGIGLANNEDLMF